MAKKRKKTAAVRRMENKALVRHLLWALGAGIWLLLAAALVSYDPADAPGFTIAPHNAQPGNWVGAFGAVISHKLYTMVGPGVWVMMAAAATYLIARASGREITQIVLRGIGVVMMAITASSFIASGLDSGLAANFIKSELTERFNVAGAIVILVVAFWVGAVLAVDQLVMALTRLAGFGLMKIAKIDVPKPVLVGKIPAVSFPRFSFFRGRGDAGATATANDIPVRANGRTVSGRGLVDEEGHISEEAGGLGATQSFDPDAGSQRGASLIKDVDEEEYEYVEEDVVDAIDEEIEQEDVADDAPGAYTDDKKEFDPDELREKMKNLPINFAARMPAPKSASELPGAAAEVDVSGFQFPGLDLLFEAEGDFTSEMEKIVRDQGYALESAMKEYRIDGEVVGIDTGPVITLYEVKLAPGTKVNRLNTVSSDLARALKAQNIRIVPNMAGKDTVGIEVPNLKKEKVRLHELISNQPEAAHKMKLPMYLAKDASGNPLVQDLATMPHMLIAGTTGSGKSVCMNSIIMSFLYTKRPDELKMVLVDPKMVEMSMFRDIPHLMCPVVTEMSKAAAILEWATTKMDERYELLAEAGVRDIASYNALEWEELKERFEPETEEEEKRIPKKIPYLVFIIDELADLMMTAKEVESFIVRLAQKARAVGIHLILATQRPQANVVTGLIKSNMPCRVSFKVASGMDSRIVLDQKGAELLLGQGDMLFLSPRTSKLLRAQGTLIDDLEVRRCVKFLKKVSQQNFEPQLVQIKNPAMGGGEGEGERDPLFDDAVRVVLEAQRGSVSLLQRRLTIGYGRASRLIEQMADAGIIGEYKGSQARETTMTLEEYEAYLSHMQAEAEIQPYAADGDVPPEAEFMGQSPSEEIAATEEGEQTQAAVTLVQGSPEAEVAVEDEAVVEDAVDDEAEDEVEEIEDAVEDEEEDEVEEIEDEVDGEIEDEVEDDEEECEEEDEDEEEDGEYEDAVELEEEVEEDEEEYEEDEEDEDEDGDPVDEYEYVPDDASVEEEDEAYEEEEADGDDEYAYALEEDEDEEEDEED